MRAPPPGGALLLAAMAITTGMLGTPTAWVLIELIARASNLVGFGTLSGRSSRVGNDKTSR